MARVYLGSRFPPEASARLDAGLADHDVVRPRPEDASASNLVAGAVDPRIAEADVVFGQPPPIALTGARAPKWVHLTSAGYTRYANADVAEALRARGVRVTTSSTVFAEPCATHALALLLALSRQLPSASERQHSDHAWPSAALRARSWIWPGRTIMVLGFGGIGRRLVELLRPLGARIVVVRDRPRGDEGVATMDKTRAEEMLSEVDAVVSTLPENASTRGFVDVTWLAAMRPHAFFVNVGRGVTVDQDALTDALAAGRLGGAGLDVTEPEPLPPEHPLWTLPNVIITPHAAGGQIGEPLALVDHFLANLVRFVRGEALVDQVI